MLTAAWAITIAFALQHAPPPPPADAWPDDRPFTHVLPNLWHDFKNLATVPSARIAVAGSVAAAASSPADDDLAAWAESAGTASYATLGDTIGNAWFEGGAAVAAYAVGKAAHDARIAHIGSDLIRAQVLNGLLTSGIKLAVDRTRPNGQDYSFPSGHSSATFASAAVLEEHFGWWVGVPAYAVGSFVSWCRVRDRAHWLSDTVAGATLGMAVGKAVTAGHREHAWRVVPARTTGGFAVYVVRIK